MRSFRALLRAQLLLLARDPAYWLSTLLIAVVSILVFGYLFTGGLQDFPLGVVDEDHSVSSQQVLEGLRGAGGIDLSEGSREAQTQALKDGKRWAVIVIPAGFGQGIASGNAGVDVYYNTTNLAAATASRSTVQAILDGIDRAVSGARPVISVNEQGVSARKLRDIDYIIPGMMGLTMMFGGLVAGVFLVNWRQQGVLRRLGVTPLHPWLLILSQMLSLLLLSVASMAVILTLGRLLFDVSVQGSYAALLLVVLVGVLAMMGLGYFISSRVRTTVAASAVVNLVGLPMMFLGGSYFPTNSAPVFIEPLVRIAPLTYLNEALRAIVVDGDGVTAVASQLLVLAAWIAATLALSARIFRWD